MKDRVVRFTGVTLNASDILRTYTNRKTLGPFPGNWERVEVSIDHQHYGVDFVAKMDQYIAANFESKWGVYKNDALNKLVVFFADGNDAIMFKLMGGDTAYLKNQTEE
jgi:hypothetical protein